MSDILRREIMGDTIPLDALCESDVKVVSGSDGLCRAPFFLS